MNINYNLSSFTTPQLKKFFKYCVMKSYDSHIEIIHPNQVRRSRYNNITIGDFINKVITDKKHNVFIHRISDNENYIEEKSGGAADGARTRDPLRDRQVF